MKVFGLSKPYAIAFTGGLGLLFCMLGVNSGERLGSLWVNLGSGLSGAFFTYLLFDAYLGKLEASARVVEQLLGALHGGNLTQKNYLLARHPKHIVIANKVLYEADLSKTEWDGLECVETTFAYCNFNNATLEGCLFERCVFTGVSFNGSNAVHCICQDCTFVSCDWAGSLWPDGGFIPTPPRR